MKIKLIITSALIVLTTLLWSSVDYVEAGELTNKITVGSDTTNTVDDACNFLYYPNTRYTRSYRINDRIVGYTRYRASWFYVSNYTNSKLQANYYTCGFDNYSGYGYYYFVWVRIY